MKKLLEVLKDILYDSIDYIIMIGIIGIVVFIIGWRLDLLFAKDALDIPPMDQIIVDSDIKDKEDPITDNQDKGQVIDGNDEEKPDDNEIVENTPEEPKDPVVESENGKIIKITIPSGSLPSKIGSILESNNLVSSKNDFVLKAQELKLDTKLKSGEYEIIVGATIEEILKIITK